MQVLVRPSGAFDLDVRVPGDKSLSHRAVLFAALAEGRSALTGVSGSRDVRSTMRCVRALGASVEPEGDGWAVTGWGEAGWREPEDVLDCGNSGTTIRLLAGVLASSPGFAVLTGDEALRRRPMARVVEPLTRMGARLAGRDGGHYAPLAIQGTRLRGMDYTLPMASAQVKSCLLLAGLSAQGGTTIEEPSPSRDHTERMLQALGVRLERAGRVLRLPGPARLPGFRFHVPGDPSSAAFLVAAAVLTPGSHVVVREVSLNPGRVGFFQLLQRMGADVRLTVDREELGEPVGVVEAAWSPLTGVEVGPDDIPGAIDEIPLLAVVATQARGATIVAGAEELRHKESDRIRAIVGELRRLGARIEERPDGFAVEGPTRLRGATVRCHRDHRLEMGLAVAALNADGPTRLTGAGWCDISFPGFWDVLPGQR